MVDRGTRRIIGLVGAPGAGKSTMANELAARDDTTVIVPMDGFHLAQSELNRLDRADRKGAPDTFDVGGYVSLLERIRADGQATVYAPVFDRHLEEPIANALAIEPHHRTVISEGNYLLLRVGGWERVRPLLDECWYLDVPDDVRRRQLVERHIAHGRTAAEAEDWVRTVDDANRLLIEATRSDADRVVRRTPY